MEGSKFNEYEHDTSDEEDIRNTVGSIPMKWYNDYDHIGYDWDGKKIQKIIESENVTELEKFLKRVEDPESWRTVQDPQTGEDVILSDEDIRTILRLKNQKIPDENFNEYAPWIEWFSSQLEQFPIKKTPDHKRSFIPSVSEKNIISQFLHKLKTGQMKTNAELRKVKEKKKFEFYMLWSSVKDDSSEEKLRRIHKHMPAPKRFLPGHAESYNPPAEYLFNEHELKEWKKLDEEPHKRKLKFIPQKFPSLRAVPAYPDFIKERFIRCLDLYLCPRTIRLKTDVKPEDLLPQLPSPQDLQPFPTTLSLVYEGHKDMVRSISVNKCGQFLLSGSDDCTVKIWEVFSGRCLKTITFADTVSCVAWCPNNALTLIGVASGKNAFVINPHVGDKLLCCKTDQVLKKALDEENSDEASTVSERVKSTVTWTKVTEENWKRGIRYHLVHFKDVNQISWHSLGDYLITVLSEGESRAIVINQISKKQSYLPFKKNFGLIRRVLFHPFKPIVFVASQRHIRVHNFVENKSVKKLMTNSRSIADIDIHPGGDNLIVATYDKRVLWFDLDLSSEPYKTLPFHGQSAVRSVAFHSRYPLFASGSDDCSCIVSHGKVSDRLDENALIVPLRRLKYHSKRDVYGVFDVRFHPVQPWLFSSGADSTIRLYTY